MDNWIQKAIKKPGALHKTLKVDSKEKIPTYKIDKAMKSKNLLTKKRAVLAKTLSKFKK